jgi:hypothetical protein
VQQERQKNNDQRPKRQQNICSSQRSSSFRTKNAFSALLKFKQTKFELPIEETPFSMLKAYLKKKFFFRGESLFLDFFALCERYSGLL